MAGTRGPRVFGEVHHSLGNYVIQGLAQVSKTTTKCICQLCKRKSRKSLDRLVIFALAKLVLEAFKHLVISQLPGKCA
jgi:hypothetical protein